MSVQSRPYDGLVTKEFWELAQKRKREHFIIAAEERIKATTFTPHKDVPGGLGIEPADPLLADSYNLVRKAVELKNAVDQIEQRVPIEVKSERKRMRGRKVKNGIRFVDQLDDRIAMALTEYALFLKTPRPVRPASWPKTLGELADRNGITITTLAQWRHRYRMDELLPLIPEVVTKDDIVSEVAGALALKAMQQIEEGGKDANPQWFETFRKWYALGEKRGVGIQINNTVVNQAPKWTKEELDAERAKMREVEAEVSDG